MRLPKSIVWMALIAAWVIGHTLLWKDRRARQEKTHGSLGNTMPAYTK